MEVRSDPFESAKSHFFDTSSWGAFCDVTLTLRQARQPDSGGWVKIDDYRCRQAFRHFMNLLNRAVYGAAFRRYGKKLRVLPVLEKGEVRGRAFGIFFFVTSVAVLLSSIVTGELWKYYGPRLPFYVSAGLAVIAAAMLLAGPGRHTGIARARVSPAD